MYVIIKYLNKSLFCLEVMKKHNGLVFSHKSYKAFVRVIDWYFITCPKLSITTYPADK